MTTEAKTKHSVEKSMALYRKAEQLIPGVAQLISRRPTRRAFGVSPVYGARAKGCRIWDIDGNEYVDWMSAVGPIILGYADEVVDNAVKEQIDRGSIYSLLTEASVELAELLVRLIPSAEMVRYAKGGGEACAVAVRIARGVTRRDRVLFCGYHGWHDWYQAANLGNEKLQQHLFSGIEPIGIPRVLEGTAIPFEYGDNNMLEDLLKEHDGEVACVIMEPMRSEIPPEGYLEGVRELATKYGVILVFDEVSCGFRVALGGAQELTGVTPDMTALAKGISNGYPMGAVVGKRDVMAPAAQMFVSSAYWDDNVGIAAALTTLKELERRDAVSHFERIGTSFKERINRAAQETGLDAECFGVPGHPSTRFNFEDGVTAKKVQTLFAQETEKRGVIMGNFLNCAHDEAALDHTETAVRESFEVIKEGLDRDGLDDLMETEVQEEFFKRLVR